ncbi:MAG TPA: CDP-alcohol phosphatidyltransferase family protein [Coleofasciculaceae cyanobacterium]|jgi:phosphatidylglycerophosphate synthase
MADIKPHQRINDILFAPLERPALQWLAANMPVWVNPDILTGIGILGGITIFLGYWLSNYSPLMLWIASLGFVINWFGDSLDGSLARHRKIERPKYGFFVDHTVDAFNEVLIVIGLGLSPYVTFSVACLALIGYLLMSVLVYIRTYVEGVFQLSYGKFGPTEVRVILILLNTVMFFWGIPEAKLPLGLTIYDLPIAFIAAILGILFTVGSIQNAVELAKLNE